MSLAHSWHSDPHFTQRIGWLRASVLGANDGIVSTASLLVGVAAADAARGQVLLAGVAGLVAGAMSMAAGEFVSVSSQADSEKADLDRERRELERNPDLELEELTTIYESRGLDRELALTVAEQLTRHDALSAHARDELGLSDHHLARPIQAAVASALAFAGGASLPLGVAVAAPLSSLSTLVTAASLASLMVLGGVAARTGGAGVLRGSIRVTLWGAVAMALTALVGRAVGSVL
ncbi:MAG: VIT family protein [Gemmatimonadota bacterium]|nr:VIT family protein [Gemmatimonadota bacterium]